MPAPPYSTCVRAGAKITRQAPLFLLQNVWAVSKPIALQSLAGHPIDEIHTVHGDPDRVILHLAGQRLQLPIDNLWPVGDEWDDWWSDFDEFLEDAEETDELPSPDDITLGDLLGAAVERVRTGASPSGRQFVMLDLDAGLSLLLPLADLGPGWTGYEDLLDAEVSAGIADA